MFRRKWRLMVKMRCSFNDAIYMLHFLILHTATITSSNWHPSSDRKCIPPNSSQLKCSPLPILLVFPLPPHFRKRKHRKHRRRRWNLLRKYFRPCDTWRIEKVQLIQTMIPDILAYLSIVVLDLWIPVTLPIKSIAYACVSVEYVTARFPRACS